MIQYELSNFFHMHPFGALENFQGGINHDFWTVFMVPGVFFLRTLWGPNSGTPLKFFYIPRQKRFSTCDLPMRPWRIVWRMYELPAIPGYVSLKVEKKLGSLFRSHF